MNSKGQIDQIVTSTIVFIVVLVIMGIFSYATNFASNFFDTSASVSAYVSQNGKGAAFMDIFLSNKIVVNGEDKLIFDVVKEFPKMERDVQLKASKDMQKIFLDKYSCGGKNSVMFLKFNYAEVDSDGKVFHYYFDSYFSNEEIRDNVFPRPDKIDSSSDKFNEALSEYGYVKEISSGNFLVIKEVARC